MQTYLQLIEQLGVLSQDRKNELDRKDKLSKFESYKETLNPYQFAVDNLEFKNQSEIIFLSMLHRFKIKDKFGKGFIFWMVQVFQLINLGTLELKR